jgi:RNA polymerase sigma-70 factor (ECF subfamily)
MAAGTTTLQGLLDEAAYRGGESYDALLTHSVERLRLLARNGLKDFKRLTALLETDDVLQEALIRLRGSLGEVRPSTLRGFMGLASIQVRRVLIDMARSLLGPQGFGKNEITGQSIQGLPNKITDSVDRWIVFNDMIDSLLPEEREVVDLLFVHGMTHEEVSVLLGISVSTSKRRWLAARLKLGEILLDMKDGTDTE